MKKVSVIVTTYNEQEYISELVESLLCQTLSPSEIIIVDSYSNDETFNILKNFESKQPNLKVIQKKTNRSAGRNFAIQKCSSELIAITDAGCVPNKNWLEKISEPLLLNTCDVVAGYYYGKPNNIFEKALIPFVLVMPDKTTNTFLPSTRSMCMKKSIWKKTGGFNEDVDPGEDYEFSNRLIKKNYRIMFVKDALVGWYPRKDIASAYRMFKSFAYADKIASSPRPRIKYIFLKYLLLVLFAFISLIYPLGLWLFLCQLVFLISWSIIKNYKYVKHPLGLVYLPVIQTMCDIAVMNGTLAGILYKIKNNNEL